MNSFVLSPWSPIIAFILGLAYIICLAIDLRNEMED